MKKTLYAIEFIAVLIILLIQPCFIRQNQVVPAIEFTKSTALSLVIAIFLYFPNRKIFDLSYAQKENFRPKDETIIKKISTLTVSFGLLVTIGCVFSALAYFLGFNDDLKTCIPKGVFSWISFIIAILVASFYEESLYRFYVPECLNFLLGKKFYLANEILALIFFAFAHSYMGAMGVTNAFFSGIILRKCFLQTKNLYLNAMIHFLYNFFAVIVSAAL